jgi:hypothetical protein
MTNETITFAKREIFWGYPLAHLLAMQRLPPTPPVAAGADSQIEMVFSTDKVFIQGKSLDRLWDQLLLQKVFVIEVSGEPTNGYTVLDIFTDSERKKT